MNNKQKRYRQMNIQESFSFSNKKKTKSEAPSMDENLRNLLASTAEKRLGRIGESSSSSSGVKYTTEAAVENTVVANAKMKSEKCGTSDETLECQPSSSELFTKSLEDFHFSSEMLTDSADIFGNDSESPVIENPDSPVVEPDNSQESNNSTIIDSFPDSLQSAELFVEEYDTEADSKADDCSSDEEEMDFLNRAPNCSIPLHTLEPLENHCVLFSTRLKSGEAPRPFPAIHEDKWDLDFVRMPCSNQNKYPVEDIMTGEKKIRSRWDLICFSLKRGIHSSEDLERAIMQYNSQYRGKWNFNGFHTFFNVFLNSTERSQFFDCILPKMIEMALNLPKICTQPIPLLKKGKDYSITMSQKQIGCLLLNAFFCTFPRRNAQPRDPKRRWTHEYASYPHINFHKLFYGVKKQVSTNTEKLKCLMNYFRRITMKEPTGTVTFHRQFLQDLPDWEQSTKIIKKAVIKSSGLIETEGQGMLQVDFANKFVGGGILGGGCVQEEIRFAICPELIVSRLFTECLEPTEVLIVTGVEQYNKYSGYNSSFKWEGNFNDQTLRDAWGRKCTELVAMDATHYRNTAEQFKVFRMEREINKAYCGFYHEAPPRHLPAVATGNWGCGAFNGNPQLKFVIQWLASSQAGRNLFYVTFGNKALKKELKAIYEFIQEKNMKIGELWKLLCNYSNSVRVSSNTIRPKLINFLHSSFAEPDSFVDSPRETNSDQLTSEQCALIRLCEDVENEDSITDIENSEPG